MASSRDFVSVVGQLWSSLQETEQVAHDLVVQAIAFMDAGYRIDDQKLHERRNLEPTGNNTIDLPPAFNS